MNHDAIARAIIAEELRQEPSLKSITQFLGHEPTMADEEKTFNALVVWRNKIADVLDPPKARSRAA